MLENEIFFPGKAHLKGIFFLQFWISTQLCTLHTHTNKQTAKRGVEVYDLDENKH